MSYSDDAVKAKLSSLNETQDSIVTVAQWIMFHRRHADRTASLWLQRLQDSSTTAKRLNLVYLANEVVQQSRARNKNDFLLAFEPIVADATALAYKSASQEVQGKLKRVVEVWRQRNIFDPRIQDATERRLKELDEMRGGGGGGVNGAGGSGSGGGGGGRRLGGSLFGGGSGGVLPPELDAVAKAQGSFTKAEARVKSALDKANEEYAKMTDPDTPIPTAPVHAAKLSALMKHLAAAEGAVEASITARKALVAELEKLIAIHHAKLTEDETTATDLATRKEGIEGKKREVEDNIMRGLSTPTSPENVATPEHGGGGDAAANDGETKQKRASGREKIERPEAEGFTPPPPDVESLTPPPPQDMETETGDPAPFFNQDENDTQIEEQYSFTSTTGAETMHEHPPSFTEPAPASEPPAALNLPPTPPAQLDPASAAAAAANEFLNNLNVNRKLSRQASSSESPVGGGSMNGGDPRLKRRKMSHRNSNDMDEDIMFGVGGGVAGVDVDEEGVSALLNG